MIIQKIWKRLDKIAKGEETCYDLCNSCTNELIKLIKSCSKDSKIERKRKQGME